MTITKRESAPPVRVDIAPHQPESWMTNAACAGQVDDWLYFDHGKWDEAAALTEARRVCGPCPARQSCLEYALADPSLVGVWGGTSAEERKRIARNRARKSRAKETTP